MNLEVADLPKLVRRPDGNWDVILDDSKAPKEVTRLAGATMTPDGKDWMFVNEEAARSAAALWWLNCVAKAAHRAFAPKVEKPSPEEEHWSVADRVAGYKFHD